MFSSSSYNGNPVSPFQHNFPFSSSSSSNYPPPPPPPPPPCANLETCTGDTFLHHIPDPLSAQFSHQNIALMAPPSHQTLTHLGVSSNTVPGSINSTISSSCGDHHHHHQYYHSNYGSIGNDNIIPSFLHSSREDVVVAPAVTKKDRHSKIFTAQGLRDRRVRLSLNVARQFFDLQDLLGLDRASKTIEWLLKRSRKAIRDLGTQKNLSCSSERSKSLSSTSECDEVVSDINEVEDHVVSKEKEMVMMKQLKESKSAGAYVAKESRAKARAKARERTREKKMCTTSRRPHQMLNQLNLLIEQLDDHETNISSSSKVNFGDHRVNQELGSLLANHAHHHHRHEEDQSALIKRNKMKSFSSVVSDYNTTDQSSSNSHLQFPSASQNWDINGAFPMP